MKIRIVLPHHLRTLARVGDEVQLEIAEPVTIGAALDALESTYPPLRGTMRDHPTLKRRPFVRFFASGEDMSHESYGTELPKAVLAGSEPFFVVGAMAGG